MADKRCDNGHFIDESWDLCPYCPAAEGSEAEVPPARPRLASVEAPRPVTVARPVTLPTTRPMGITAPPPPSRREPTPIQTPPMERTVAVQKIGPAPGAEAKRYVVGWLIGLNASARGEAYAVRMGRNILGRDRRSDIVINDEQASSHHADLVFRPEERRFILMDHNSTNGTYVNEAEIEPRRDLAINDVVRIGAHKFLFMPLCHEGFYWDAEGALQ